MLGMSEEQFWKSNPRKMKVWQMAHQEKLKEQNRMLHLQGYYNYCAISTAIGQALDKNFKGKYLEEPIRRFPLTEAEQKAEYEKEMAKFMAWTKQIKPRK